MTQRVVRSSIPGRTRWEIAGLRDDVKRCSAIGVVLQSEPGIRSAKASHITGSVLIVYDLTVPVSSIEECLDNALRNAWLPANGENGASFHLGPPAAHPLLELFAVTKPFRKQAILTFVIAFVDRLFEAAPPAMIGAAMDVVNRKSNSWIARFGFKTVRSQLFALGGLSLAIWALDSFMGYLHRATSARLAQAIQDDLRNRMYGRLQQLDVGQIEQRPIGAWTSLFDTDIGRIGQFIETGVDPIVTMLTNSLIVTVTFLMQSPALFAAQLVILPGLYLVSTWFLGPIRKRHETGRLQADRLSAGIRSNVTGISTINVFGRQDAEAERIAALSRNASEAAEKQAVLTAAYIPAIQMVVGAGFLTTLVWGGNLVERGKLSIASFNVMGFTSLRLLVALGSLGMTLEQYQRTTLSIRRVLEFLHLEPAIADGRQPLALTEGPALSFQNVSFEYQPGNEILHKLNLKIGSKNTTAIVGSTGAGKTTVLKLILRYYDPLQGAVNVNGEDIREYQLRDLRRHISLVPQHIFLFSGTIRDNIAYSRPKATTEEIMQASRTAHAHDFIQYLPDGYDTLIDEDRMTLSGGEQQRIAIARAILADRRILLFDEATSAVDYETEAAIQKALREELEGRTVVIVAHRLSTVRHADWIYVLDEGRIAEEGRHEELLRKKGIYANLWRIQTGESAVPPRPKTPRKRKS